MPALAAGFHPFLQLTIVGLALSKYPDFLLQFLGHRLLNIGLFLISSMQFLQVLLNLCVDMLQRLFQLLLRKVPVFAVDGLEFAPVNGNEFSTKQIQLPAQEDKLTKHLFEGLGVVFSKVSNRFEVWSQFP